MMTVQDIKTMLKILSANYENIYKGTDEADVLKLWSTMFANDDPALVMKAVLNCINTMSYKPTIADIRVRMAKSKIKGQMTPMEAFQEIAKARDKVYDKESATNAFNSLPPLARKTVGSSSILVSWSRISDEAFHTVVMSAIRESYREFAQRQLDYNTMPDSLQRDEDWMVAAPTQEALPEPEKNKSIDEVIEEANQEAAKHSQIELTPELKEKHAARVNDFLKPMSKEDLKRIDRREQQKFEQSFK